MDPKDPTKVICWIGAVGPTGIYMLNVIVVVAQTGSGSDIEPNGWANSHSNELRRCS